MSKLPAVWLKSFLLLRMTLPWSRFHLCLISPGGDGVPEEGDLRICLIYSLLPLPLILCQLSFCASKVYFADVCRFDKLCQTLSADSYKTPYKLAKPIRILLEIFPTDLVTKLKFGPRRRAGRIGHNLVRASASQQQNVCPYACTMWTAKCSSNTDKPDRKHTHARKPVMEQVVLDRLHLFTRQVCFVLWASQSRKVWSATLYLNYNAVNFDAVLFERVGFFYKEQQISSFSWKGLKIPDYII